MVKLQKTFTIAEAGVNHNGNLITAMDLAKSAKKCGADAVKFQTFWNLGCLSQYEFTKEQWIRLKEYCDKIGIEFMSTPHWGSPYCGYKDEDFDVIDFVDSLVKRHKIASPYLTNKKYVEYIASKGKPIYLSTGSLTHRNKMAILDEIKETLSWIPNADITLMHCVSEYPCNETHNERLKMLRKFGKPVGISSHTLGVIYKPIPVIEKHFKLDDNCIDANVSINPKEFKLMVKHIREHEDILRKLLKK